MRENDVIASQEQWALVRKQLANTKYAKLLLKTISLLVIQCLAMFSNNEVTEGLLIAVLRANFVLLFLSLACWTALLYFRQARRLAIAIGKRDCDELIDWMLSGSGGTAEQQLSEVTAGDSLASPSPAKPDAVAEQQRYEATDQKAPYRLQKYRERLASVAAG